MSDTGMPLDYIPRREELQLPVGRVDLAYTQESHPCIDRTEPASETEEHRAEVPQAWLVDSGGTSGETGQLLNMKAHELAAGET